MKNSGFKMKGYAYPGKSPLKEVKSMQKSEFESESIDKATDLMASEGFKIDMKKSPATLTMPPEVTQALTEAAISSTAQIAASKLSEDKKNSKKGLNTSGFSSMNFGKK